MNTGKLAVQNSRSSLISSGSLFRRVKRAKKNILVVMADCSDEHVFVTCMSLYAAKSSGVVFMNFAVRAVLSLARDTKITSSVIVNNTVDMINKLLWGEISAKNSFHNFLTHMKPASGLPASFSSLWSGFLRSHIPFSVVVPSSKWQKIFIDVINNAFHLISILKEKAGFQVENSSLLGVGYRLRF